MKYSLLLADYVSFRDDNSQVLVRQIGFTGRSDVVADSVYSLNIPGPDANRVTKQPGPIVGISPMAYCDPRLYWQKDYDAYHRLIHNLALFGSWLGRHKYHLALFSTETSFDSKAIEDLKAALKAGPDTVESHQITHTHILGIDGLLSEMHSMDYIVTCRFHGVVFAHLLNKPVLALSHHPKVFTLMNDLGLAQYCVDIRSCDADLLMEIFASLVNNSEDVKSRMAEKLASYQRALTKQLEDVFSRMSEV